MKATLKQYDASVDQCKEVFLKKTKDYGTAWRILRLPSLTDQLFIKANRIRSIQEKGVQKVEDSIEGDFMGIVNYSIMALIQEALMDDPRLELRVEEVQSLYEKEVVKTRDLFISKNHDYDESWREMRLSSFTDLILMKLLRIKQIEDNAGSTLISEGVDANYRDIMNYAVFALIQLSEKTERV